MENHRDPYEAIGAAKSHMKPFVVKVCHPQLLGAIGRHREPKGAIGSHRDPLGVILSISESLVALGCDREAYGGIVRHIELSVRQ